MKDILRELGFYFIRNKQYLAFFSIINSRYRDFWLYVFQKIDPLALFFHSVWEMIH